MRKAFTFLSRKLHKAYCSHPQVYGPSDQNDWDTAVYPGIANAIASARSSNTSESWKFVQHEIYRVARAVTQASAILSGRLT
jgi:N-acetylated-alpha-linked acidic dipeptidase